MRILLKRENKIKMVRDNEIYLMSVVKGSDGAYLLNIYFRK